MSRVLVTGPGGFLGRFAVTALRERGFEVHGAARRATTSIEADAWHTADLLNPAAPAELIRAAAPSHLLHLAWTTEHPPASVRRVEALLPAIRAARVVRDEQWAADVERAVRQHARRNHRGVVGCQWMEDATGLRADPFEQPARVGAKDDLAAEVEDGIDAAPFLVQEPPRQLRVRIEALRLHHGRGRQKAPGLRVEALVQRVIPFVPPVDDVDMRFVLERRRGDFERRRMENRLVDHHGHVLAGGGFACQLEVVMHRHRLLGPEVAPAGPGEAVEDLTRWPVHRIVRDNDLDVVECLLGEAAEAELEQVGPVAGRDDDAEPRQSSASSQMSPSSTALRSARPTANGSAATGRRRSSSTSSSACPSTRS